MCGTAACRLLRSCFPSSTVLGEADGGSPPPLFGKKALRWHATATAKSKSHESTRSRAKLPKLYRTHVRWLANLLDVAPSLTWSPGVQVKEGPKLGIEFIGLPTSAARQVMQMRHQFDCGRRWRNIPRSIHGLQGSRTSSVVHACRGQLGKT